MTIFIHLDPFSATYSPRAYPDLPKSFRTPRRSSSVSRLLYRAIEISFPILNNALFTLKLTFKNSRFIRHALNPSHRSAAGGLMPLSKEPH